MPFWNNTTYSRIECAFFYTFKPRFRGIWKNMGKVGTLFCACYTLRKRYVSFLLLLFPSSAACRNVIGADSGREPNREAPTKYSCMGEIVRPLSATGGVLVSSVDQLGVCPPFGALKPLKPLLHVWKYVAGVSKWQRSDRRYGSNPPNSPRSPRALFSFLFYFMSPIGDFFLFSVFAPLSF